MLIIINFVEYKCYYKINLKKYNNIMYKLSLFLYFSYFILILSHKSSKEK